ncbi:MAG: glycine--tRNA ligase subunit beta, partial [Thermostichales cyanobacterium DRC_bins_46]
MLLEVGTEELPASFVHSALEQWQTTIPNQLQDLGIPVERVRVLGTPRRLALILEGLPERQP